MTSIPTRWPPSPSGDHHPHQVTIILTKWPSRPMPLLHYRVTRKIMKHILQFKWPPAGSSGYCIWLLLYLFIYPSELGDYAFKWETPGRYKFKNVFICCFLISVSYHKEVWPGISRQKGVTKKYILKGNTEILSDSQKQAQNWFFRLEPHFEGLWLSHFISS